MKVHPSPLSYGFQLTESGTKFLQIFSENGLTWVLFRGFDLFLLVSLLATASIDGKQTFHLFEKKICKENFSSAIFTFIRTKKIKQAKQFQSLRKKERRSKMRRGRSI